MNNEIPLTRKVSTRRVFSIFVEKTKPYGWWIGLMFALLIVSNIIGVIGPIFYKRFFDTLAVDGSVHIALWALLSAFFAQGLVFFLKIPINTIGTRTQAYGSADLTNMAFGNVIRHSYEFFSNSFVGSIMRRVQRFSDAYENISEQVTFALVPIFVSTVSILVVLFWRSSEIGWIVLGLFSILLILNYAVILWKQKYEEERTAADSALGGILSDSIGNHTNVRIFSAFKHEERLIDKSVEALKRIRIFTWTINDVVYIVQLFISLLIEVVVMLTALKLYRQGVLTIGDFVLFQSYIISIVGSLWALGSIIKSLYQSVADAKEMVEIIDKPYDVKDTPDAQKIVVKEGAVEFKDVAFGFSSDRTVINNFNLSIQAGEKVAFVGLSGAGKTTLIKLLLRFYDIDKGIITIDGQDISKVTQESLRDSIALVPQDPLLFHRSLKDNIRYGRLNATDEEILEAAKKAQCHDFINKLPNGYDTFVGEYGIKLSGGERQRVAIARAMLKDAPILILDEATSSLDSESEYLVQKAFKTLIEGKTVIVIAHRLSTIGMVDKVAIIDHGTLHAVDAHKNLLETDELYKKLWKIQAATFLEKN